MPTLNVYESIPDFPAATDVAEWRLCYEGGSAFKEQYLSRRVAYKPNGTGGYIIDEGESESPQDFIERKGKTPTPTYAKRAINKIRNALVQRFVEIAYRGGSKSLQSAIAGEDRGVDLRGRTMNAFIADCVLADLLVIGKIGVFVDFPKDPGQTLAEVSKNRARPFLYTYPVEEICGLETADRGDTSEWKHVSFKDVTYEIESGIRIEKTAYRAFDKDPTTGKVVMTTYGEDSKTVKETRQLSLTEIPFVLFDLNDSLIKDACSYQIQLLGLMSNDTAYCLQANFPFMVRQRAKHSMGEFIEGSESDVKGGEKKGLWYEQGLNAPSFISPAPDPVQVSILMRQESKKEVEEIVNDALQSAANTADGLGGGLAFIGSKLQSGIQALLNHWAAYESANPARREMCVVKLPERWAVEPMKDRLDACDKLATLQFSVSSRTAKKGIQKYLVDQLGRGVFSIDETAKIKTEIDESDTCVGDPKTVIMLKNAGLISAERGVVAIGSTADDAKKAQQEMAERQAMAKMAQQRETENGRGVDDAKADPVGDAKLDKEASRNTDGKATTEPPVRGEGKDTDTKG